MKNLLWDVLKLYFDDAISLAKIKAAAYYVKTVKEVRSIFIIAVMIKSALLLMLSGFILMHLGVFIFFPWSARTKAIVLLILGGVYFFIPALYILRMCSQRYWMQRTRASNFVKVAVEKK